MNQEHDASRRRLLQAFAAAPLAIALPAWGAAASPRLTVLVYLYGGNDGYNTWVPYTDRLYYELRPNIAVPRDAVLKITDRHGFHPSLASLVPAWEARELALIQGIGHPDATQQHYRDSEIAFTGCDGNEYPPEGWVTRALAKRAGPGFADAVAFDRLDVRASDPMGPFRGEGLAVVHVQYAFELLQKRRLPECIHETNAPGRARISRAPDPFPAVPLKTTFGADQFGQAIRAAVELAALDRNLAVIHVALNGEDGDKHHSVDCHWKQLDHHGDALQRLAKGLAALRSGLKEIGRWEETLVVTYDEFGRSPVENEDRGTHHGLGTTHFVLGGRVKGGLLGTPPPVQRLHPIGGPDPVIDIRELWTGIVERWWGMDASRVFSRRYRPLDLLRA